MLESALGPDYRLDFERLQTLAGKPSERVTLADVAEKVGLAPSTVSYILRKVEPHFSRYAKDTIARVEQAATEAGYAPSLLATSLRLQQVPYFGIFFEFVREGDPGPAGGLSTMMWEVYEGIANMARLIEAGLEHAARPRSRLFKEVLYGP